MYACTWLISWRHLTPGSVAYTLIGKNITKPLQTRRRRGRATSHILPFNKVLHLIGGILEKKAIADAIDDAQKKERDTLPEFTDDFFVQQYGTVMKLRKVDEFRRSVLHFREESLRVQWFSILCGWHIKPVDADENKEDAAKQRLATNEKLYKSHGFNLAQEESLAAQKRAAASTNAAPAQGIHASDAQVSRTCDKIKKVSMMLMPSPLLPLPGLFVCPRSTDCP